MKRDPISKIDLDNPEFLQAYELLKNTNANIFLTGRAGTGKSTFLNYICRNINKNHVILAPTGVAAVNVGGVTIHSFFQMPLRPVPPDDPEYSILSLKRTSKLSRRKIKLIQKLELIVIDEVSMVRPDMIDFIDRTLRAVTGKRKSPFGGIQILLVGDIFQLEPVVTNESKPILAKYYPGFFFFNARVYSSVNLIAIELKKIYRQSDKDFINLLDRVRIDSVTTDDIQLLNSKTGTYSGNSDSDSFGITLTSRRDSAAKINKDKMEELPGDEFIFKGEIKNDFPEKILPTDLILVLKKDAQVMLIRNDKSKRWVNGTLAKICDISNKRITVELEDGKQFNVDKEEWQNINYIFDDKEKKVKEEIIGTFTQYPLKAAWALTIHKSQGLTFNNVTIDMSGGAFSAGQTYVALSRCRTLDGLRFINPLNRADIIVSSGAAEYSKNFNNHHAIERELTISKANNLSRLALAYFNKGDFKNTVEALWEANILTGLLAKPGVRKLITKSLDIINQLKNELKVKNKLLMELSQEFTNMGNMMCDKDNEEAYRHFAKAYKLDPSNKDARLGMARSLFATGQIKNASKILDELIYGKDKYAFTARILKGEASIELKDYSTAAIHFHAALKMEPDNIEPVKKIISVYETAGLDELADQYREFLDKH